MPASAGPSHVLFPEGANLMAVIYASNDALNQQEAIDQATSIGMDVRLHEPRDGALPPGLPLIVDADFWAFTPAERAELVRELLARAGQGSVGVHGYQLTSEERKALQAGGVHVHITLEPALFTAVLGDEDHGMILNADAGNAHPE
jgi:hypothetical protein